MTAKVTSAPPRKAPMSNLEVERLRAVVLSLLANQPTGCVAIAKRFNLHQKTMMNHLRKMQQLGLIHAERTVIGKRNPYLWSLGMGGEIVRTYKVKPGREAVVRQATVRTWPACQFPQQSIFSSLGL